MIRLLIKIFVNGSKTQQIFLLTALAFFILIILLVTSFFVVKKLYSNKVYPNIYLADQKIDGFTPNQLNTKIEQISSETLTFVSRDQKFESSLVDTGLTIDREKTYADAMTYGRTGKIYNQFYDLVKLLIKKRNISPSILLDQDKNTAFIERSKREFNKEAVSAEISLVGDQVTTKPETVGYAIKTDKLNDDIKNRIRTNNFAPYNFKGENIAPTTTEVNLQAAKDTYLSFANKQIILDYNGNKLTLTSQEKINLLAITAKDDGTKTAQVSDTKVRDLMVKIASENDQTKQDKKIDPLLNLIISQGKNGMALNIDSAVIGFIQSISTNDSFTYVLPVTVTRFKETGLFEGRYVYARVRYYTDWSQIKATYDEVYDKCHIDVQISWQGMFPKGFTDRLYLVDGSRIVNDHELSVLASNDTPAGSFSITEKLPLHRSTYNGALLEWWQRFSGPYGIHGSALPGTSGCLSMWSSPAKEVYDFTSVGTPVYINRVYTNYKNETGQSLDDFKNSLKPSCSAL